MALRVSESVQISVGSEYTSKTLTRWRKAGDAPIVGANEVSDEAHSERAVDRRGAANRSNGDQREP